MPGQHEHVSPRLGIQALPEGGTELVDHLERVFSPESFMPHGVCFLWNAKLLWLHALSDGLILPPT
jgi:hypothetical protein